MSVISRKVLDLSLSVANSLFEKCKKNGTVEGDFQGQTWRYKGKNILFTEVSPERTKLAANHTPLPDIPGRLARCFAIKEIARKQSGELVVGRLVSIRHLAWIVKREHANWPALNRNILDKTIDSIRDGRSAATTYHWATSLSAFVDYLNQLSAIIDGVEYRYLDRFIKWNHGVPNPIRSSLELTSPEFSGREQELYTPDLHTGLARARSLVKANPSLEPHPGYDLIRLEATSFGMALGLRIGEICGLPKNCLDKDGDTGLPFVRVPTLKGALCSATAVAEIWYEPLKQAFDYLTNTCAAARERAAEIEKSGFSFIDRALNDHRKTHPLSECKLQQLKLTNLRQNTHFFIDEITSCLDISPKELSSGGRFHECTRELPRIVGARVASWLDERFRLWDWSLYTNKYKVNLHSISVLDIGKHCGSSKAAMIRSEWFIDDLRAFMERMRQQRAFNPETVIDQKDILDWSERWSDLRSQILSHRGGAAGGPCTVVDIQSFKDKLESKFRYYLSMHFKEQFPRPDAEDSEDVSSFVTKDSPPGHANKLSDHMIVIWENQFNSRANRGIIPRPILRSDFYHYLSANAVKQTIFQRLKLRGENGEIFSFTPHHIRRWVTTAVLRAGPSETAIDLWMGRTPHQTRHYDYRTAKERAEHIRSMYMTENPPADFLGKKVVRWREEGLSDEKIERIVIDKLKVLNYTPWGGCSRELYVNPCNKGLMCLRGFGTSAACESFHINVHDLEARSAIESLRDKYKKVLETVLDNYEPLTVEINQELDHHEPLDQHILFMSDLVRGCNEALKQYSNNPEKQAL